METTLSSHTKLQMSTHTLTDLCLLPFRSCMDPIYTTKHICVYIWLQSDFGIYSLSLATNSWVIKTLKKYVYILHQSNTFSCDHTSITVSTQDKCNNYRTLFIISCNLQQTYTFASQKCGVPLHVLTTFVSGITWLPTHVSFIANIHLVYSLRIDAECNRIICQCPTLVALIKCIKSSRGPGLGVTAITVQGPLGQFLKTVSIHVCFHYFLHKQLCKLVMASTMATRSIR